MKKKIILFFALLLCLYLLLCIFGGVNNTIHIDYSDIDSSIETPRINTMYPDDVVESAKNIITVEKAEADLRANKNHECLEVGVVNFDKLTFNYPNIDSIDAIYWFDISIPYDFGNENYCAKVIYRKRDGYDNDEFVLLTRDIDIWQMESTFTQMGKWEYDDGETSISINFIEADDSGYIVEYEIAYFASYWTGSHWVESSSARETKVYGHNEWDGENNYLYIDLEDYYNESGQTMDRGYIKVYPWDGVYWDALHVNGGPYKLSK